MKKTLKKSNSCPRPRRLVKEGTGNFWHRSGLAIEDDEISEEDAIESLKANENWDDNWDENEKQEMIQREQELLSEIYAKDALVNMKQYEVDAPDWIEGNRNFYPTVLSTTGSARDCANVVMRPGSYSGCSIGIEEADFEDVRWDFGDDFTEEDFDKQLAKDLDACEADMKKFKAEFGGRFFGTAGRFSNGETVYKYMDESKKSKIKENTKITLTIKQLKKLVKEAIELDKDDDFDSDDSGDVEFIVKHILWDASNREIRENHLPSSTTVMVPEDEVAYDNEEDYISEWLSDTYGFGHKGFIYDYA